MERVFYAAYSGRHYYCNRIDFAILGLKYFYTQFFFSNKESDGESNVF